MFVVIQVEEGTSATFKRGVGLVGTYNTFDDATSVVRGLAEFYEDEYEHRTHEEMSVRFASETYGEISWFVFDADDPEWIKEL